MNTILFFDSKLSIIASGEIYHSSVSFAWEGRTLVTTDVPGNEKLIYNDVSLQIIMPLFEW